MAIEARELKAFLNRLGQAELAKQAGNLAAELEARNILRITPRIELPRGVRTETLIIVDLIIVDRTKEYFSQVFGDKNIHVTFFAQSLIDQIDPKALTERNSLDLIWLSGRDLGLRKAAPYQAFLEAGQAQGYRLLNPEVALYLRDFDNNQPLGDVYWLAMTPMTGRYGDPRAFALGHSSYGLWLDATWVRPEFLWSLGGRLVFQAPASEPQKP